MNRFDDSSCWDSMRFGNFTLLPRARSLEFDGALLPIGSRAIEILTLVMERAVKKPILPLGDRIYLLRLAALRLMLAIEGGHFPKEDLDFP